MKKIFGFLILCIVAVAVLPSCSDDDGDDPGTVSVSSDDDQVDISADGRNIEISIAPVGGEVALDVNASGRWSVIKDEKDAWCTVTESENTVTVSAPEFISDYTRRTMFRIATSTSSVVYVTVTQLGTQAATLVIDPESVTFSERGGSQSVEITTNKDEWDVTGFEDVSWLDVTKEGDAISLTAAVNELPQDLTVNLTVTAGSGDNTASVLLPVTLAAWTPAYVTPDRQEIVVPLEGGTARINVDSNREWTATESASWFSVERDGDVLIVTADNNTSGTNKSAQISFSTTSGSDSATATVEVRQYNSPFVLEYTITKDETVIGVPLYGKVNCFIDWGDGTTESINRSVVSSGTLIKHEFERDGKYNVKMYGQAEAMRCGNEDLMIASKPCITAIVAWGDLGVTNMYYAFYGTAIKTIPPGYENVFPNVTDFTLAFYQCDKLEQIPADMFTGCSLTKLEGTFFGCKSLTSIPAGLLAGHSGLTTISSLFRNTGITAIPSGLFNSLTGVKDIICCFANCESLTTIPDDLLDNCTQLTSALGAFEGCTALTTIPAGLFKNNTEITQFDRVFSSCTKLTAIPTGLLDNCKKAKSFYEAFYNCRALSGSSPYTVVGPNTIHLYERDGSNGFAAPTSTSKCFAGCTGLSDYASIPAGWID